MSDVKVELNETVNRDDAAAWLAALAKGLGADGHVKLPLGAGVVSVHVPDRVRAEVEVEVEGDEVEIEVEFKWSTVRPEADPPAGTQAGRTVKAQQKNGARRAARAGSRRLGAGGAPVLRCGHGRLVAGPGSLRTHVPGAPDVAEGPLAAVTAASPARRWLARLTILLVTGAVVFLVIFGGLRSVAMLAVGLASAALSLAAAFWFLALRGVRRWAALAVLALSPIAALVAFALAGLLWVAAVSAAVWVLAGLSARVALAPDPADWKMPERSAEPPAARPYLIMNPRSGGRKVAKFDLKRAAERLGAEVYLMTGPDHVDVAEVARAAVARGADLLGVAGGDGTQALVAGVAADAGIPFMVISAGTRNHFALDLGLDREDPTTCLSALDDGVDLRVDLGRAGTMTFVNNASFGAYAEVVQSPAYRDDKIGATLNQLPDLLDGHHGSPLTVHAGDFRLEAPQAVLVANNPYGTGDLAGLGRRTRLDRGKLAVVGVHVDNGRQAAGLLRGRHSAGLRTRLVDEVTIDSEEPAIPVGVDGEAVMMPTPVHCVIRPGALRVRVPRDRPGVRAPKARMDWARLRQLAGGARQ